MPTDPNEDLAAAVAVHLVGMAVPVAVVAAFEGLLSLYLSGTAVATVAAVAFGLVAWLLVEELDLDRPNFLVGAVVATVLGVVALVGYALVAGERTATYRYLFYGDRLMLYPGLFGAAGVGAVGLSRKYRSLAAGDGGVPPPRRVVAGIGLAVALLAVLGVGANLAAANSAAVATVEPGTESVADPALNVTVAGPAAELRVTAVAPDGETVTERLSRAETRGGPTTASIRMWFDDTPPPGYLPVERGTYRVRVTSLAGVPVDRASFVAETGVGVSIEAVEATRGNLSWERQPRRAADAGPNATTVGVVVENRGDFLTPVDVILVVGDDDRPSGMLFLSPGERNRVAYVLDPGTVEAARAGGNGTATVRAYVGGSEDPVATATVDLPDG
ncbi:MAG: hypothetical protein ABEI11_01110 [Haloarculaceae archaeon]